MFEIKSEMSAAFIEKRLTGAIDSLRSGFLWLVVRRLPPSVCIFLAISSTKDFAHYAGWIVVCLAGLMPPPPPLPEPPSQCDILVGY